MRNRRRRLRAVMNLTILIAAGALILGACGSDDGQATDAQGANEAADGAMEDGAMEDGAMEDGSDDEGHDHSDVLEVPDGMAVPEVALSVEPDAHAGYNVLVDVENFTIAPENASTEPVDGEGHLHLYVNGERLFRFYNTELNLVGLPAGEHEFTVEVSSNGHTPYGVDGTAITASETVTIEATDVASSGEAVLETAPVLDLEVMADPKSGWNVRIDTDFDLGASSGRAVLSADDTELVQLFGPWWHVAELPEGQDELTVTLRTADNETVIVDGQPLAASVAVPAMAMNDDDGHSDHAMTDEAMADDEAMTDADVVIMVSIADGTVTTEADRVEVPVGSAVAVTAESDVADELHVHGFDKFGELAPGVPTTVTFVADVPGIFEVELEQAGTFLFEVSVS